MIIAIETATDVCGTAVVHEGRVVAERIVTEKNIHSEKLLPMIDGILRDASLSLNDIDAVAVSIGPGSFTGLRIGLSTAKGLALAMQKAIIAVPTLDALAYEYCRTNPANLNVVVCPLIDAKRDEVFYSFYEITAAGINRRSEYSIESIVHVGEEAARYGSVMFVGDGTQKMETMQGTLGKHRFNPEIICNPASVGILAEKEGRRLTAEETLTLEPLYLRDFVTTRPGRKHDHGSQPLPAAHQTPAHSFKG
jgi:tRNA threonylcarbamoyladenosine biosynthesis protein TsaB